MKEKLNNFYKEIIFFKKDLTRSSGYSYLFSQYSLYENTIISKFSKYDTKLIPSRYKIIFIFFLLPFLYILKFISINIKRFFKRKPVLLVGHPSSLVFILNLLRFNVDAYPVDTLYSYFINKEKFIFLKIYLYMVLSVDKFIYYSSSSYYFLNTFSKKTVYKISKNSNKFRPLIIGINEKQIDLIKSGFKSNLRNFINIGIYSNFLYSEHQIFIQKFFKCFDDKLIDKLCPKYSFKLAGLNSEFILNQQNNLNPNFKNIFSATGFFDSLYEWISEIDYLIIPFLTTCGIKIKLYESIASCKPVMVNKSVINHLPKRFLKLYPSIFIYKELNETSILEFLKFANNYYLSKSYNLTKLNLSQLGWNDFIEV